MHSALEAKGLTAVFSTALSEAEVSCNVVAAFHHDHIFVAAEDASKAMQALRRLSAGQAGRSTTPQKGVAKAMKVLQRLSVGHAVVEVPEEEADAREPPGYWLG